MESEAEPSVRSWPVAASFFWTFEENTFPMYLFSTIRVTCFCFWLRRGIKPIIRPARGWWSYLHSMVCQRMDHPAQRFWIHSLGPDNPTQNLGRNSLFIQHASAWKAGRLFYCLCTTVLLTAVWEASVQRQGWERSVGMGMRSRRLRRCWGWRR